MAWYDTGTVSVTNGSTTVTGSGTNFVAGVQVGEGFSGPDGRIYEIQVVVSATALTLADPYLGATQSGQAYKIVPTQSLVAALATQVSTLISDFQGVVDEAGSGKFDDGTATSAGITFTLDQDTGIFRPAANQIGFTTAGVQRAKITNTGVDVTGTVTADGLTVDGNVGIGTSSPASIVGGTDTSPVLSIGGSDSTLTNGDKAGSVSFITNDGSYATTFPDGVTGEIASIAETSVGGAYGMAFYTGTTSGSDRGERLRIDASGNMLVGKTSANFANAGVQLQPATASSFTQDGVQPLVLNRLTSDGDILKLFKDGSTVGGIGANGGKPFIVDSFGVGVSVNRYNGESSLMPAASSAATDAAGYLGGPSNRWKDLYLSSGVYLGGAGAANKLDDYEEGGHTASVTAATGTITLNSSYDSLAYTKVGRKVTVTGRLLVTSVSSPAGKLSVSLPFAVGDLTEHGGFVCSTNFFYGTGTGVSNGSSYYTCAMYVSETSSVVDIYAISRAGAFDTTAADWIGASSEIYMNLTYFTA